MTSGIFVQIGAERLKVLRVDSGIIHRLHRTELADVSLPRAACRLILGEQQLKVLQLTSILAMTASYSSKHF